MHLNLLRKAGFYTLRLKQFARALSKAQFPTWYLQFYSLFFFFFFFLKSHKNRLSFKPHQTQCHQAWSPLPKATALRCFPFFHHLLEAFLLCSSRQVAITPSGNEKSHCSPLSHSNNIICLIKRQPRKREWVLTSWVIKDSTPLVLSYFLFSTHYFGFINFITTWQREVTDCFYCK